jgi:alkylation response protein AidB-like acyl-CoA dehydrogenase
MMEIIEEVSAADGAAGWCVNISSTTSSMSWYLEPAWAKEIFGRRGEAYGGAFAPTGKAVRGDDGWVVNGRWMCGSGTNHCAWVTGGTITEDGQFHLMFFPRADVELLDTWHSSGLRGTGSTDFQVTDRVVPAGRSVMPLRNKAQVETPLAHFPNFNLLAAGLAAVCIGIARRAVEEFVSLAFTKTPQGARAKVAEYAPAQLEIARAEALVRSSRAYLRDEVAHAWETTKRGERVGTEQRARVRLACYQVAIACAQAVDLAYNAGGGSSVFSSNPLQRCFRDIHTATQHQMLSDRNLLTYGRIRLGVEADTAML